MAGLRYIIDPEEAPLELGVANGIHVFSPVKSTPAQSEKLLVSSIETEGELAAGSKTGNAEITPRLRLVGSTEKQFRERQIKFDSKVDKLKREGGIMEIIFPDGGWIKWEIRDVSGGERLVDNRFVFHKRTEDEITFVTAPYGEGEEQLLGTFKFTGSAKWLLEAVAEVGGTAPALARAVITSPEADLWRVDWGRESQRYSEAPTAKLYYAAQELTALGGAAKTTATVDGVAGTPVVRQGTLTPTYQGMLSTQIEGVGPMTHQGVFEALVWVHMPATNTGEVGAEFEYGVGDMVHRITNAEALFEVDHFREGKVVCLGCGELRLRAAGRGDHRWEGRVVVKSSVTSDDFDVLGFGLRPLEESNGSVAITPTLVAPASVITRDGFSQSSGNLNEKTIAAAGSIVGPKYPATVAEDLSIGEGSWSSIESSKGEANSTYASTNAGTSRYIKATNPGFAIPGTATITGIQVEVLRHTVPGYSTIFGGAHITSNSGDRSIKLCKAGVPTGNDYARLEVFGGWPTNDAWTTYGGPGDLWGTTWTPAQVNATNFGALLACSNGGETVRSQAFVDAFRITVYYDESGGQKWATSGDAVDIAVVEGGHVGQRTEVSDADINTGRFAIAGSTVFTDTVVGLDCKRGASAAGAGEKIRQLVLTRCVDPLNWLGAGFDFDNQSAPGTDSVRVFKRVAGSVTELGKLVIPESSGWRSIWLDVDRRGRFFVWGALAEGAVAELLVVGVDSVLATGGALASGKVGFYDAKTGATANTRQYDNFNVWIPSLDAVAYEGLSLQLSHDAAEREALGGGVWSDLTPEADYLKLAPAGMEARKNRLAFIASPNDPDTMSVGFPKKIEVALYATPRYRTVPDPA